MVKILNLGLLGKDRTMTKKEKKLLGDLRHSFKTGKFSIEECNKRFNKLREEEDKRIHFKRE